MDSPPAIVMETADTCGDSVHAEEWVRESMRASVAPKDGWRIVVTSVTATHVVGVLEDDLRMPVAHRDLYVRGAHECEGTMHALGVWASLVLDAEVDRAHERERLASAKSAMAAPAPPATPPGTVELPTSADASGVVGEQADAPRKVAPKPVIELGMSSTLGSGVGASSPAYLGAGLFTFIETVHGVFLRPSVAYAHSLDQSVQIDWGSTRFDLCARAPGNYTERKGLQFDACLGPEGGLMKLPTSSNLRFLVGFGPSISLRGELASAFGIEVRATTAYNFVRGVDGDPIAPLSIRAELGVSWGAR